MPGEIDLFLKIIEKKIKSAVADLDHDLLTIEAQGDYNAAKKMLDELGVIRPNVKSALDGLKEIPTDIEPIFVTAEELAPSAGMAASSAPVASRSRRSGSRGALSLILPATCISRIQATIEFGKFRRLLRRSRPQ